MRRHELLTMLGSLLARGVDVKEMTIHPADVIDLMKDERIRISKTKEKILLWGITLKVSKDVPRGMVKINDSFLEPDGWNPSAR